MVSEVGSLDLSLICGIFLSWIHWFVHANRTHVVSNGGTSIFPTTGAFAAFDRKFVTKLETI